MSETETTETRDVLNAIPKDPETAHFRHWVRGELDSKHMTYEDYAVAMKLSGGRVCLRIGDEPDTAVWWFMWLPEGMQATCGGMSRKYGPEAVKTFRQGLAMRLPVEAVLKENTPFGSDGDE